MSRQVLFMVLILLLGFLLRFLWLDLVPHSINGDELHYVASAKAFALTGKDITQSVTPLDILIFRYPPHDLVQAELPYFLEMITVGIFPFSLAGIALPTATLSFFLIFIMYLVVKKLLNEQSALIAAFLTAINPWFIAEGRTTYEMVTATFFYMAGFYILLVAKKWRILLALPIFILAFYSYIATKLIFLPLIIVFCIFCYFVVHKKQYLKQYLILLGLCILFVGFFVFQLQTSSGTSRMSEILTPAYPPVADQVDYLRKNTMSTPLLEIYENKLSVFSGMMLNNLFEVFSLKYLFLHGDYFFSFGSHGLMYLLDPIFLFIGAAVIYSTKKKHFLFLVALCGIAVLPQIVHSTSLKNGNFSPHTTMLLPFLIIFIAAGIWEAISWAKKKKLVVGILVIGAYIILLGNFVNTYFFLLPLQHNFYSLPNRLSSIYASHAKNTAEHVTIYAQNPHAKFQEYLVYTNSFSKQTVNEVLNNMQNKSYTLGNVSFISCDGRIKEFDPKDTTIIHVDCGMTINYKTNSIVDLSDSGAVYKIINDSVCKNIELKPYLSNLTVYDFAVDKMTPEKFCKTFITPY